MPSGITPRNPLVRGRVVGGQGVTVGTTAGEIVAVSMSATILRVGGRAAAAPVPPPAPPVAPSLSMTTSVLRVESPLVAADADDGFLFLEVVPVFLVAERKTTADVLACEVDAPGAVPAEWRNRYPLRTVGDLVTVPKAVLTVWRGWGPGLYPYDERWRDARAIAAMERGLDGA